MAEKLLTIKYSEYTSMDELPSGDRRLMESAIEALKGTYAPYSDFNVGAAVLLSGGTVVKGANQENIAYPSGLCAERTALFAAGANYPEEKVTALAIVAAQNGELIDEPATPCGACRQVMAESQMRSGCKMRIILGGAKRIMIFDSVDDVLPFIFDSKEVKRASI
jgi:cytidine deaminase